MPRPPPPAAAALLLAACRPAVDEPTTPGGPTGDDTAPADTGDHPAGVADLSAEPHADIGSILVVRWTQEAAATGHLAWTLDGATHAAPEATWEAGAHEALLLGIPYGVEVEVALVLDGSQAATVAATTDPLPATVPVPELVLDEPDLRDPAVDYVVGSAIGRDPDTGDKQMWTFIVDRAARVVWARPTLPRRVTLHVQRSRDGTALLIDHSSFWVQFDDGADSQVERVRIDGSTVELVDTPGLHHPFTELEPGTLAWPARDGHDETILVRAPDGTTEALWNCTAFQEAHGVDAWCGSNTLWWDPATDHLLYSSYATDTVVEIDRATGETLRWFGHVEGAWAFDPADAAFWWQHGAHLTDEGTLLVSARAGEDARETVVREYALDADAETLRQVWSFGEGEGLYAEEMGEAERSPNGDVFHNLGSAERLREITPDGEVVWDIAWPDADYLGRTTLLSEADLYAMLPDDGR